MQKKQICKNENSLGERRVWLRGDADMTKRTKMRRRSSAALPNTEAARPPLLCFRRRQWLWRDELARQGSTGLLGILYVFGWDFD
jgi:hypothetical protein